MVTPRSIRLRAGGLDLHVLAWGAPAAPAVLLIHGAGMLARWWDPLAAALAVAHHLIVPDLRGHGLSAWSEPAAYQIEDCAADLDAVLAQLALARVAVVGHSMGGRVATWLAARAPERAWALGLFETRRSGLAQERIDRWRGKSVRPGPQVVHRTRAAALAAFRLTPPEPAIAPDILADLAAHAVVERAPGEWALRFDRAVLALAGSRVAGTIIFPDGGITAGMYSAAAANVRESPRGR